MAIKLSVSLSGRLRKGNKTQRWELVINNIIFLSSENCAHESFNMFTLSLSFVHLTASYCRILKAITMILSGEIRLRYRDQKLFQICHVSRRMDVFQYSIKVTYLSHQSIEILTQNLSRSSGALQNIPENTQDCTHYRGHTAVRVSTKKILG